LTHTVVFLSTRILRKHRPTLFPYTTLFRSRYGPAQGELGRVAERAQPRADDLHRQGGQRHHRPHRAADWRRRQRDVPGQLATLQDRKSTRLNSSHVKISYAVFCLKKKKNNE